MRIIPKKDLLSIIENVSSDFISDSYMRSIFKYYGDDYIKDNGLIGLTNSNRKDLVNK